MDQKPLHGPGLATRNFYCVYCLAASQEWVKADHLIWREEEQAVFPVCDDCKHVLVQEKFFFNTFSFN